MTKSDFINDISSVIDNSTSNTSTLSDAEQATILQVVMDYIQNHVDTVNPNVKPMPHIKFIS